MNNWLILFTMIALFIVASCAHNPCVDNPRNMSCMSASELEKELS